MIPIINEYGFHVAKFNELTHKLIPSPLVRVANVATPIYDAETQVARYIAGDWILSDKVHFQGATDYLLATIISVSTVSPLLMDSPNENEYTVSQNVDVTITADMDCPDGSFRIPIIRTDTAREVPVIGTVKDKVLTVVINFPTAGYWECGNEQINSRLPAPLFDMKTLLFVVI